MPHWPCGDRPWGRFLSTMTWSGRGGEVVALDPRASGVVLEGRGPAMMLEEALIAAARSLTQPAWCCKRAGEAAVAAFRRRWIIRANG